MKSEELVVLLRERCCPSGEPWTGDNPKEDHGHTDCYLMQMAADKIELLKQIAKQFESLRLESGLEDGMMNIQLSRKKVETLALRPWISTISLACKEALDRESGE